MTGRLWQRSVPVRNDYSPGHVGVASEGALVALTLDVARLVDSVWLDPSEARDLAVALCKAATACDSRGPDRLMHVRGGVA